ncbi:MAG: hypothetical protein GY842_20075, partial [bacterium]|nr:hypothetical protein [bacterium]
MDGRYGKGLAFDGVDDFVQIGDAPDLRPNQYTLSLWFKWDDLDTADTQFLTAKGPEHLEIHTGGSAGQNGLRFIPAGPSTLFDVPNVIQTGWNHIALVYVGGSHASVYHNGVLVKHQFVSGGDDLNTDTAPLVIGKRGDGSYPFDGTLDEVLLFDQALSEAEVAALFAAAYNPDDLQVQPGDSLHYHATAENSLTFQYARGLLDVSLPGALSGDLPTQRFDLRPGEQATLDGNVQVSAAAATGLYTITQLSGASITDPRESSNLAEL